MSNFKTPKIGVYGQKDRALQKALSYERTSLTWHPVNVYKYLGSATNGAGATLFDIADAVLMENADREYDPNPILINAHIEQLPESPFDLSKFGIISPLADVQLFKIHVNSFEAEGMGRFIRTGDVIEAPFFEQDGQKAFFEVTDVDKKPAFESYYVVVTTVPIKDSQEFEGIDGIPTNSDALADLQSMLDLAASADVAIDGLNPEPSLYVMREYVVDDYLDTLDITSYTDENGIATDYDPRPDLAADFLDDPNAQVF